MPALKHYLGFTEELSQELEENFRHFNGNWNKVRAIVIGFPFQYGLYTRAAPPLNSIGHMRRVAFLKFASILCEALVNHRCTDIALIADVLHLVYLMCSAENDTAIEHCLDWLRYNNSLRNVTKFEKLLKIPYNKLSYFLRPEEDAVRYAATTGNVGLLDVLLQFGAMPRIPEDDIYEQKHLQFVIKGLFKQSSPMCEKIKRHLLYNLHSEFSKDAKQRIYLMMIVMNIFKEILNFVQNNPSFFTGVLPRYSSRECLLRISFYTDCARKLFTVIPDPFVSADEIRRTLGKLCLNIYPYEDIDKLANKYESHFPESRETSAPRQLQHLCKVQVRESLRAAGTLIHGVDLLPIPKKIKDYVLLKDVYSPVNVISLDPRNFKYPRVHF